MTSSLRRGDVVPFRAPRRATGHEQRGQRYAIVVQSDDAEWLSTILIVPTSTSATPTMFRPSISVRGRKTRAMTDQLTTVDRSRVGRPVGRLSAPELQELDQTVKEILGLF